MTEQRLWHALAAALRAPLARPRLVFTLWLARMLPILAVFTLPAYEALAARTAHHPDAGLLLDRSADTTGFAYSFRGDFFRDGMTGVPDTMFWLIVLSWGVVSILAGGVTACLLDPGVSLLAESGRFAGRCMRLALLFAVLLYLADGGMNAVLAKVQSDAVAMEHTQDLALSKGWLRGGLFLAIAYLLGLLHAYARIDLVARDRRSAFFGFFRGAAMLLARLPRMLALEAALLLLAGLAALLMWLVLKGASPIHPDASWFAVWMFVAMAAVTSYLRTGIEVGALEARCGMLVKAEPSAEPAPEPEPAPSQIETPAPDEGPYEIPALSDPT
ncbi:MAG: hypothetical protein ACYTGN_09035 [Planctomycetota bacterium]|jgi:hypothetical protein